MLRLLFITLAILFLGCSAARATNPDNEMVVVSAKLKPPDLRDYIRKGMTPAEVKHVLRNQRKGAVFSCTTGGSTWTTYHGLKLEVFYWNGKVTSVR